MTTSWTTEEIRIERWVDQPADAVSRMHLTRGVDVIFWATSARPISDVREREAFRDLWLGDYLADDSPYAWVALTPDGDVVGYLAGSVAPIMGNERFAGLGYFGAFGEALRDYPAHLHINLDEAWRNRGIGRRLIDAFAAQVRAAGHPGFHVVTGATSRNVSFYTRAGFAEIARTRWKSGEVVFLGRQT